MAENIDGAKNCYNAAGQSIVIRPEWPLTTCIVARRWAMAFPFVYPHDAIAHHQYAFKILASLPRGRTSDGETKKALAVALPISSLLIA